MGRHGWAGRVKEFGRAVGGTSRQSALGQPTRRGHFTSTP
ncbi:hypothetical protein SHJG_8567 [Streptomyces hygroscopicus subsp. jinggangensis 5008]|nr:hypothetical protein SHJG_8567 [Streptomyces hygroscopicus subsp. jinggangensis 5008]AGF67989.1 hypothetical protein SHJGH_8327 [Streptomyces hygroscopicus subsp. jinggangensis TL01]